MSAANTSHTRSERGGVASGGVTVGDGGRTPLGVVLNFVVIFSFAAIGIVASFGYDVAAREPGRVVFGAVVAGLPPALVYVAHLRGITKHLKRETNDDTG